MNNCMKAYLIILNIHFFSKKCVGVQMCNFNPKRRLRQHAGTTTIVLSKKKAPAAARSYKNKGFSEQIRIFKNVSKTGRNELKICFSHYLGASENDFDNEMPPNT